MHDLLGWLHAHACGIAYHLYLAYRRSALAKAKPPAQIKITVQVRINGSAPRL